MEAGLRPMGCTPTRDGRASQCCVWPCTRASSHHAKCHPSSSHCAGFSSPCFRFEGRITLMLEIQHPWGGTLHPFPVKKDGEGKSIPPLPEWSPATPQRRRGGRLNPSQLRGFTRLQVWPNCKTTGTSGEPPVALETFPQIAFSEGSTAQGKEGGTGLAAPGRAELSFPARP